MGFAQCPAGTRVVAGGVESFPLSPTNLLSINGTFPLVQKNGWQVYVNNASTDDAEMVVLAVCVKGATRYSVVVGHQVVNRAGTQSTASVSCPANTVPLGGGGVSTSTDLGANLNSSVPVPGGWQVRVNNNSTKSTTAFASVVCTTRPRGYAQVAGDPVRAGSGAEAYARATCGQGLHALGGGGMPDSTSTLVNLDVDQPYQFASWDTDANNNSDGAIFQTPWATCGVVN